MAGPINDEASLAVETNEPTSTQTPAYKTAEAENSKMLNVIDTGSISIIARIGAMKPSFRLAKIKRRIGITSAAIWTKPSISKAII